MQIKLLKDMIDNIIGKQSVEIVDILSEKKDVNEFLIAKKLKLTINQTRNILYKLSDVGLVSFMRKKDKRKGWYIYFWTLNSIKSLELLEKKLSAEIAQLENQLKNKKTKRFYFCKTCNVEVGEETALLNDFTCRECGQIYELAQSDKVINELESKISKLRKEMRVVTEEKQELLGKEGKRITRKRKRAEKKEKEERKAKREREKKKKIKENKKEAEKKIKKNKKTRKIGKTAKKKTHVRKKPAKNKIKKKR